MVTFDPFTLDPEQFKYEFGCHRNNDAHARHCYDGYDSKPYMTVLVQLHEPLVQALHTRSPPFTLQAYRRIFRQHADQDLRHAGLADNRYSPVISVFLSSSKKNLNLSNRFIVRIYINGVSFEKNCCSIISAEAFASS